MECACRDLAETIGAPSARVAGLGVIGATINCDTGEADDSYSKSKASLAFGVTPQSLESTLQRFSKKTEDEIEASFAMIRFEQAVMGLAGGAARRTGETTGRQRRAGARRAHKCPSDARADASGHRGAGPAMGAFKSDWRARE